MPSTLITAAELNPHLGDARWAVVDCRFSLDDCERGRRDYEQAHIPGAVYAHLDHDLSGEKVPGKTGRHPLPEVQSFAQTLSAWGIDSDTQVVVYDDLGGSMAARLWWMLRWMGHCNVALLDGGWQSWLQTGLSVRGAGESRTPKRFEPHEVPGAFVSADEVEQYRSDPRYLILDARSALRFRGEIEPVDAVAGHIPGAVSAPWEENLTPQGTFLSAELLHVRYSGLVKSVPAGNVICYCGSGVTAAHDIVAISHAGLGMARLYPGSWSEWITNKKRPVATI